MLKMKKLLSVALALVLVFSLFTFSSSALADSKEVGIVLKSDKTIAQIVPGATVTVTFYFEMADWSQLMSDTKVAVLYDSTVYTPDVTSRTFLGDWAGYAKDATTAKINAAYGTAVMNGSTMSDTEKAKYNSAVMLTAASDAGLGATNKAGYSVTQDGSTGISVAQCSLVFNVTGDAEAVAAGNLNITVCDACNTNQFVKKTDGSSTPGNPTTGIDASKANIFANMPAAPAGPALAKAAGQVQMTPTATNACADSFKFRVISSISDEDWTAYFSATDKTATATTPNAIQECGMVAYRGSTFNADTAKALAQSAADSSGTTGDLYLKGTTTYISHSAGSAATFGTTMVFSQSTLTADDITYIGYVKYTDAEGAVQFAYYDAEQVAPINSSNIATIVSNYLALYPFVG